MYRYKPPVTVFMTSQKKIICTIEPPYFCIKLFFCSGFSPVAGGVVAKFLLSDMSFKDEERERENVVN